MTFIKHNPVEFTGGLRVEHPTDHVVSVPADDPSPFQAVGYVTVDTEGNLYRPDGSLIFDPEAPGGGY